MEKENLIFDNLLSADPNVEKVLDDNNIEFPFKVTLSFELLMEHIKSVAESDNDAKRSFAGSIIDEFSKAPELHGQIRDVSVIKKHEKLIDNMMMFVFPSAFWDKQTYAAFMPYSDEMVYASPKFRELIKMTNGVIEGELNIDLASYNFGKTIIAFVGVLSKFYGVHLNFDFPLVYKIIDPVTSLDRYFKLNTAAEFVNIIPKGKLKKLTEEEIENIKVNIHNVKYLREILEPENFEYSGFVVMNVINISDTEILSAIKKDLIEKDTITSFAGFMKLQHKLKSLLKCPELLLGITDYPGSKEQLIQCGRKVGNSLLMNCSCLKRLLSIKGSIYDHSIESRKVIIIDDLEKHKNRTIIEDEILGQGIRNILIAPLIIENEIVGILELGSPNPGKINMLNSLKLREVLPLFAMAVERSREDINNKVRSIIKEKCTAIHPTLEWKFQNAALNYLNKENDGKVTEMEEIIFDEVYPLYGLSDIRNSSNLRNDAIREDLVENLELARNVILSVRKIKDLKVFDELNFRIERKIDALKFGIDSGDEAEILKFLNKKIIPLFDHIQGYGKEVRETIENYNSSITDNLKYVYKRRKNYEESSNMISNIIASYLDEEQKAIQEVYPHYFERYKTDGVDHSIYIGASLVENQKFNRLYLRNIRMWQLMIMCGIVRKANDIKKELPLPLETAHLVLVQDSPLSIKFRYDEKKFDVDGAYNIKYEIMKKRIDKAEIKGREERLTQPDKIAIVYSQTSEAQEYLEYIEYLQSQNYLKREVEELELEELQGIKGLKALRITVDINNGNVDNKMDNEKLKEAVKKMSLN